MSELTQYATLPEENPPQKKPSHIIHELVDYLELIIFSICVVIALFTFVARLCTVEGESMIHTLNERDSLIVSDVFYTPERGDVIVFHQTGTTDGRYDEPLVKRVIATSGETVSLTYAYDYMTVEIAHTDGTYEILEEPYVHFDPKESRYPIGYMVTYTIPENHMFVMGDNRTNSLDSRSFEIGLVDTRRVLGKVLFRVQPLSEFGAIQ